VTGTFVLLKLAIIRNGLRQSAGRTVGWVLGTFFALLYALGAAVGMGWQWPNARTWPPCWARCWCGGTAASTG